VSCILSTWPSHRILTVDQTCDRRLYTMMKIASTLKQNFNYMSY
jgi:hypothetical protein